MIFTVRFVILGCDILWLLSFNLKFNAQLIFVDFVLIIYQDVVWTLSITDIFIKLFLRIYQIFGLELLKPIVIGSLDKTIPHAFFI